MDEAKVRSEMGKVMKKKTRKTKGWYWSCGWEHSYFGRYHPDAEYCGAHGRKPFKTEAEAKAAGERHMATHGHDDGRHSYNVNVWRE